MVRNRKTPEDLIDRLPSMLSYDPQTGILRWLEKRKGRRFELPVGNPDTNCRSGKTYLRVKVNYQTYLAHRLIWVLLHGRWPDGDIDHQDGDGTNNVLTNLREVPHVDNQKNMRRSSINVTGCTGVVWLKKARRWASRLYIGKRYVSGGHHVNFEDAVAARKALEVEHGFHPNHGQDRPL